MNMIIEAKIKDFLRYVLHVSPTDCGTVVTCMRTLAQVAGFNLDERFASAGLGAGPEGRVAASIVDRALGGGGCDTSEYAIRQELDHWLRTSTQSG